MEKENEFKGARQKEPSKKAHDRANNKSEVTAGPSNKDITVESKCLTIMTLNLHHVTRGSSRASIYWHKLRGYLNDGEKKVDIALLQEYKGQESIVHYINEENNYSLPNCFHVLENRHTELCILLRKDPGTEWKFKTRGCQLFEEKKIATCMCCLAEWKGSSYFIANLHFPDEKMINKNYFVNVCDALLMIEKDYLPEGNELPHHRIIGGDFNFVHWAEDSYQSIIPIKYRYDVITNKLHVEDVYPRSMKPAEFTRIEARRIDRLYVTEKLLDGVDSVWTGDIFSDHRPVFFSAFLNREKECHCGENCIQDTLVRCYLCCKWVCDKDEYRILERMDKGTAVVCQQEVGEPIYRCISCIPRRCLFCRQQDERFRQDVRSLERRNKDLEKLNKGLEGQISMLKADAIVRQLKDLQIKEPTGTNANTSTTVEAEEDEKQTKKKT